MAVFTLPPASFSSGVFTSPAVTLLSTARTARIALTMPNSTERSDPTARLEIELQISVDAGATWKPFVMAGWNGANGLTAKGSTLTNPPPTLGVGWQNAWTGKQVRVVATLNRPMSIGAVVTT